MWFILNFGPSGYTTEMTESFGAMVGRILVPVFRPVGLGYWQIILALISGIAAKEVVVSSTAVLFGVGNVASKAGMASLSGLLSAMGFGSLNAYVMMVFCLLYVPCAATIGTIKRESESVKFTFAIIGFQLLVAWLVAFLVYHLGGLLV
jgi:ferrous iron transport protein B